MSVTLNRSLGVQRNKLLRYKLIKELYQKSVQEHPYTPTTKILEIYIVPIYPISRTTLYEILCTSVTTELKEVETAIEQQRLLKATQTQLFA
ncbi:hypothetical protein [Flavobacterium geliluteum]|uniref:Uncharacterized protein n=1 Tax=Flavobacterium geliluteum TaxID=2816120 RepID=A0A940XH14_9FLAO|nr:hypothetical protein [Flavobacterium geliluteum]MBP4139640.1 hypothetical protein [Flavobacterium geliluteum]